MGRVGDLLCPQTVFHHPVSNCKPPSNLHQTTSESTMARKKKFQVSKYLFYAVDGRSHLHLGSKLCQDSVGAKK